jgi:hypothetical protein
MSPDTFTPTTGQTFHLNTLVPIRNVPNFSPHDESLVRGNHDAVCPINAVNANRSNSSICRPDNLHKRC